MDDFDLLDLDPCDLASAMEQVEHRYHAALEKSDRAAIAAAAHDISVFRLDGGGDALRAQETLADQLADLHDGDDENMAALFQVATPAPARRLYAVDHGENEAGEVADGEVVLRRVS